MLIEGRAGEFSLFPRAENCTATVLTLQLILLKGKVFFYTLGM